ncbi:basic-leucine zipper transcription factor [Mucor lusitanicus]|uniref:Basic-leucine zipper transcription factor n=2 Tax=Mucor circinelloides f. lusitanicus TaxID=29924 RepID=A0A168KQ03_MUCCL|nr:basic-leucine zipper transcription factor [Mucor lusitanicus]OAD02636.1 basic-leucine zipper transcription factor [Mucor lusitanicus CBS 277.49]
MMAEDNSMIGLATPTRFLIENGEWNLTPSLSGSIQHEINPFDDCNYQQHHASMKPMEAPTVKWMPAPVPAPTIPASVMANTEYNTNVMFKSPEPEAALMKSPPTPPMSLSQSPSSSTVSFTMSDLLVDTPPQASVAPPHSNVEYAASNVHSLSPTTSFDESAQRRRSNSSTRNSKSRTTSYEEMDDYYQPTETTNTKSVQSGRKRRIVFEGDDAEDRRKKFLERNRVAAYKCRQKKKNWMQELEQKAEIQNNQNEELRNLVALLKEESMYLRNLLLTHGNCDCDSVQAYLRKQSAEITNNTMASRRSSMTSNYPTMPSFPNSFSSASTMPSFSEQSTGLTPFLDTVINKLPQDSPDYFSTSHLEA